MDELRWTFGKHGVSSQVIVEDRQLGIVPASAPSRQTVTLLSQEPVVGKHPGAWDPLAEHREFKLSCGPARCVLPLIICLLTALLSTFPAYADNAITYPADKWDPYVLQIYKQGPTYLPSDFDTGLTPPPANDDQQTKDDLAALFAMQTLERTPDQVKKIKFENELKYNHTLNLYNYYGLIEIKHYPQTMKFVEAVLGDVSFFIVRDKKKYNRARPTQLESLLTTVIPVPLHASYPSGHAGQNWMTAELLSDLDPVHRKDYEKLALDIAHRREIAGVHYPSDSVAGRLLASNVIKALYQVPEIKRLRQDAVIEMQKNPPVKK